MKQEIVKSSNNDLTNSLTKPCFYTAVVLSLLPLRLPKSTKHHSSIDTDIHFKSSLFIREETLRNRRYDWFSPAYRRCGLCVAEIACSECVTEGVRLEPDSAVKQCFISCISITVHYGPCMCTQAPELTALFVVATNLLWSGIVVPLFINIFNRGYHLRQGKRENRGLRL